MAVLAVLAFGLGLASLRLPGLALPLTGVFAIIALVTGASIARGAERFARPR